MPMQLGIDRLLNDRSLQRKLGKHRCSIIGHPASVDSRLEHSLDALSRISEIQITSAFGPQHGMRGDKQDNMIESDNYVDPVHGIPVFSLYGEVRRPTDEMLDTFDILLFDVQDLGCRIYTYISTLLYLLEDCARAGKKIWVLDRPNPAGRPVEGTILETGWESFVGVSEIIMRHGLTTGEIARWFVNHHNIDVDLDVIEMLDYDPDAAPGYGWPRDQLAWVNPSPNASSLNMARCFPGTVMLEGATLSEGRGTTVALEVLGAPDIDAARVIEKMQSLAPDYLQGAILRPCFFEPVFHKHQATMCQGFQIHTDYAGFNHTGFRPYRLVTVALKAIRLLYPDYDLWRQHAYEYEFDRLPIDLINGGPFVREWIDNPDAGIPDLENRLQKDENYWRDSIREFLIY